MTTSWSTQSFGQVVIDTYQKIKQQKPRLLTRATTAIIKIFTLSNKWRLEDSQYHYLTSISHPCLPIPRRKRS